MRIRLVAGIRNKEGRLEMTVKTGYQKENSERKKRKFVTNGRMEDGAERKKGAEGRKEKKREKWKSRKIDRRRE